jgi:hypothetical protein
MKATGTGVAAETGHGELKIPEDVADRLLACAMTSAKRAEPNMLSELFQTPSKMVHGAFYGSYDWHSAVHSHWTIAKLLKSHSKLPQASAARKLLQLHLTESNLAKERQAVQMYLDKMEMPYGFGWLLMLVAELATWDDDLGRECIHAIKGLESDILHLFHNWLEIPDLPNRIGQHDNTAFGMLLLLQYAKKVKNEALAARVSARALKLFEQDTLFEDPEPETCFLSPSLCVLHLMSLIMSPEAFVKWLAERNWSPVCKLVPVYGDPKEPFKSHLIGLNFSRCWSLRRLALFVPAQAQMLEELAASHQQKSLPQVPSGEWMGDHWTATFALLSYLN